MKIKNLFFKPKIEEVNETESAINKAYKALIDEIDFEDLKKTPDEKQEVKKEKNTKFDDKKHYLGHRKRLKEKFEKVGSENFEDYEILELLLMYSIPRADVKPIAKTLMNEFKSIRNVFLADHESLSAVKGLGDSSLNFIKAVYEVCARIAKEEIKNETLLNSPEKVVNYCKVRMSGLNYEQFRVIFLDKKSKLLMDEVIQKGTIDKAVVFPREIVKRAINVGASAMILLHNHPSGDPTPSKADIDATLNIKKAAALMDIKLHDHIIIGKNKHYSMRINNEI